MSRKIQFLVCPPDLYSVDYVINPWMEGNIHKTSPALALAQWDGLVKILKHHAEVEEIAPQPGLPDMVFTANAGLAVGKKFALSRFLPRERRGEEPYFKKWFKKQGFEICELPPDLPFEGAGDALLDRRGEVLWAGYGFRTELDAHPWIARWLNVEVLSLRLIDPRFYHLDTCFCPLERGYLLYYPQALDAYSNRLIEQRVPEEKRIVVSEADAARFACNAVNIEDKVILSQVGAELRARLEAGGFQVIETPLGEFIKSGGAAKCLTLRITEPEPPRRKAKTAVQSRELKLEGHLLDSGLLERALDLTVQSGGSFQILHFNLGKQRHSTSNADIRISAPSEIVLDRIVSQMIELGAVVAPQDEEDAELKPTTQLGVAPDDFLSTTIYPTEVRVKGEWVRVQDQRMDGVIVVDEKQKTARCTLFRYLQLGDRVVVGSKGVRTVRKTDSREVPGGSQAEHEFSFMGAGVSSERRVELTVDQIAWDMRRIRQQGGRVVVVPGPVVIHTGGGEHLSWLIREGYVHGLLSGNAIAVHDIEQSLMGTSLGVDLKMGGSVEGGHRHHLKAINTIRGCGSIAKAVEQGVLTRGVFYDCVKKGVPFALAGSIRDDGPLPDTQMDLIKAQEEYSQLIKGAELILMLSSMLHSIGVGNMTPAGVKLVCVDINPAVVTKLSDRGSVESIGIVTDVGLFLNLLTQRLQKLQGTEREGA
ncbi:TIGR00300 family protein [Pedosphaera parvula]|uniref:LOR/SDH bifunctional protein conserved domain protein n=1 Tax=Pedosphaera parvula (strain Ellin514) TaxID=320771 RepID=B9X9L7_PEDPL|nr:TIGR00300 family protein [Pedosphaera parvula]EEF63261.1 LOR/SDH bifunctional protein conserved domain protein [Pedosphaera parvula Ellin514]